MHYTVYRITNSINNKTYIGCHQTDDIDDGYMGSGVALKQAYIKHGIEYFDKEILHIFDNADEMFSKEAELVTESYVTNSKTYNMRPGGIGGALPGHISEEGKRRISEFHTGRRVSKETRKRLSVARSGHIQTPEWVAKRAKALAGQKRPPRSQEWKQNISSSLKGRDAWNKGVGQPTVNCPHCDKVGGHTAMYRWHFDKCKENVS